MCLDTYPAPIYPGYPAPMTTDRMTGKSDTGYGHSMYAPPSYDETKRAL